MASSDVSNVPAPDADKLETSKWVREFLHLSARTVWTLTNSGQLPCVRIGKCVRFRRSAVLAWIERQERKAVRK